MGVTVVRTLVVDDDLVFRETMAERLVQLGLPVDTASGGREAVQMCQTRTYRLIIMDFDMPDMTGFDATRLVREMGCSALIAGCSGTTSRERYERAMSCGMNIVEGKFIKTSRLVEIIALAHQDKPHAEAMTRWKGNTLFTPAVGA
jgi:CheY-like chemotaxis protein